MSVAVLAPAAESAALRRLELLADPASLRPLTPSDGTGVLTAALRLGGRPAVAFATDPAVQGGALGRLGCERITAAYELALGAGEPVVGVWHSGGARLGEGVESLDGVGAVFAAMTRASGRIAQVSVVLGAAAGGAAYGPALTDVVILGPDARLFVTGPDVVRAVTGEQVDMAGLGGPAVHAERSGVAHLLADSEVEAMEQARSAVALLSRRGAFTPVVDRPFAALLPDRVRRAYDVRPLVHRLLDEAPLELHARWAPNIVTCLGRLGGHSVGVIANNPLRLGGCLDALGAEKAARFVRLCDAFGLPLAVLVDVPGYLPGTAQEWGGVVRRGAKLLHAFAEAVVPRVTVLTRKAYGGAYIAMNSRALGATKVLAWPDAQLDVMGAPAAVRVLRRRELAAAPPEQRAALEQRLADEHEARRPDAGTLAAEGSSVDAVIDPDHTRSEVWRALAAAPAGRGAHRNIPL